MSLLTILAPMLGPVIDRVIPDVNARAAAKEELQKALMKVDNDIVLGQIDINKLEAQNPSTFVSGWRPFLGWVCGVGFGYHFLVMPLLVWGAVVYDLPAPPQLDAEMLYSFTTAMLGLAGIRGWEKIKGAARR